MYVKYNFNESVHMTIESILKFCYYSEGVIPWTYQRYFNKHK